MLWSSRVPRLVSEPLTVLMNGLIKALETVQRHPKTVVSLDHIRLRLERLLVAFGRCLKASGASLEVAETRLGEDVWCARLERLIEGGSSLFVAFERHQDLTERRLEHPS